MGGGMNSNNHVKPNFRLSYVVLWLTWGFDKNERKKLRLKLSRVNKICARKVFGEKKDQIKPKGRMHDTPPPNPTQKIVGLNLCSVVVSFVR